MRTDPALGGATPDSLAGVSGGLQSPGSQPPPEDAPATHVFPSPLAQAAAFCGKVDERASVGKKLGTPP